MALGECQKMSENFGIWLATTGQLSALVGALWYTKFGDLANGGALPETNEIVTLICSCHNFFSLSSVQIRFIPTCCLLCVL